MFTSANAWRASGLQEKTDPLHPSVNNVLTFLHVFHINRLSYSTISTACSALASCLKGLNFLVVTTLGLLYPLSKLCLGGTDPYTASFNIWAAVSNTVIF